MLEILFDTESLPGFLFQQPLCIPPRKVSGDELWVANIP